MQVGAENKSKLIAAVALMVVALGLVAHWIFGSEGDTAQSASASTSSAAVSGVDEPARPAAPARKAPAKKKGTASAASRSLDPTLRYDLLRASEETEYKGSGRNIFQAQME